MMNGHMVIRQCMRRSAFRGPFQPQCRCLANTTRRIQQAVEKPQASPEDEASKLYETYDTSRSTKVTENPQHEASQSDQPLNFVKGRLSNRNPPGAKNKRESAKRDVPPRPSVDLSINGTSHNFSAVFLRDLCSCPSCLDPSTKQKLFSTADLPAPIQPRAISQDAESGDVSILWDSDLPGYGREHVTELSGDLLRNIVNTGFTGTQFYPSEQTLWDAAEYAKLEDIDYNSYMQSDTTLYKGLQQLRTHGLLFLTDCPESEKAVSDIAERIGPVKNTFYGYTWDVRSVPDAKNVAYTSQDLGFHMDLLYMVQPPHLQFLHCIRSSSAGGASVFTDSYKSARDLLISDEDKFSALTKFEVTFQYNHPSSHLYKQRRPVLELPPHLHVDNFYYKHHSVIFSDAKTGRSAFRTRYEADRPPGLHNVPVSQILHAVNWSPPFQGPFTVRQTNAPATFPDHKPRLYSDMLKPKVDSWHDAAATFSELLHRPDGVYERMMGPGECVIFDNRRVLHGRKAFEIQDAGKERWLRGAYLDSEPYWSKLRVLAAAGHEVEG